MKNIPSDIVEDLERLEEEIEKCIDQSMQIPLGTFQAYNALIVRIDLENQTADEKREIIKRTLDPRSGKET